MDMAEIAVPAISAAGGAGISALALKMIIQSWFKRHEDVAALVQNMVIQLTRVEERVTTLQRAEERTQTQDRSIAVMQTQLAEMKDDLNGIGRKVRGLEQQ